MSNAGPQVENGYTKIANELLDAVLQFGFSKRQMAVLFAIVRKTYGFNKTEDDMTVTQLAQVSGLARQNASSALSELESIGAVSKRDGHYGYVLKINKNYQTWGASKRDASKRCASKQDGGRIKARRSASQNDAEGVSKRCTQKTTPKDNSKRQSPKETRAPRPAGLPQCVGDELWGDFVEHRRKIKKPMTDKAAEMVATKLQRFQANGHDPRLSLEDSIASGWTGVFEPKGGPRRTAAASESHSGFGDREYTSHIPDWAQEYATGEMP